MQSETLVSELFEYLPHRPPMVWAYKVLEVDKNKTGIFGVCSVLLTKDSLFIDSNGYLNGSAAIELTAQTYGYGRAVYHINNDIDDTPTRTFLTGVRFCRAHFKKISLENTKELHVHFQLFRQMNLLVFVRGKVYAKGQPELLAEAEIQVYAE